MKKKGKLKITGIRIKNFRSFKEFPDKKADKKEFLEVESLTTLVGKNDVGKSNLLKAIKILLEDENITNYDFHKLRDSEPCEISIKFEITDTIRNDVLEIIKSFKNIESIKVDSSIILTKKFEKNRGKITTYYFLNEEKLNKKDFTKLKEKYFLKPIFIPAVKNVEDEIKFKKNTIISELLLPIIEEVSDAKSETKTVRNLVEQLKKRIREESKKVIDEIKEEVKKLWDDIEDINIEVPNLDIKKAFDPEITVRDKYLKEAVKLEYRGNGLQRYFILSMLEVYRKKKVGSGYILLFEEPEIYLHAGAQRRLFGLLKDFSKRGQVIITTHSSIFVDRSELRNTYLIYRENGETKFRKMKDNYRTIFNYRTILDELDIKPSDIYLSDGIIFVEGPSDVQILKIILDELYPKWDELNISILHLGGKGNIRHLDIESLKSINPHIVILLDGDALSDLKERIDKLGRYGIPCHIWKKEEEPVKSIENLFSKNAIENVFGISLDRDINSNECVKSLIENKMRQSHPKWEYNKIKHGKQIIEWMIKNNDDNIKYFKKI